MQSVREIKKKISDFVDSEEKFLIIPYEGYELNPRHYWHKIVSKDLFSLIFHSTIIAFSTALPGSQFKNFLLRRIGMKIGKDVFIAAGVLFDLEFPELINIKDGHIKDDWLDEWIYVHDYG